MSPLAVVALAAFAVCLVAFDAYCLVDLDRAKQVRNLPKSLWALIICVSTPWGGVAYLSLGREHRPPDFVEPPYPGEGR
jgi:hypothetical protein